MCSYYAVRYLTKNIQHIHPAQYWTLLKWTSFWSTISHFSPNWVRSWRSPNLDAFNTSPIWYNTKCFCFLESSIMSKFLILDSLHSTLNNKVWPVGKIPLISLKDVQKLRYSFPKIASKWKFKKNNNNNKEKRSTDSKTFHDILFTIFHGSYSEIQVFSWRDRWRSTI